VRPTPVSVVVDALALVPARCDVVDLSRELDSQRARHASLYRLGLPSKVVYIQNRTPASPTDVPRHGREGAQVKKDSQ
jgi:hypothetical protein